MKSRVKIPGVRNVITICSAKGGVGKSTTSVNVALAMKNLGYSVGLVDADVTGPSIPTMLSLQGAHVEAYRHAGLDRFQPPSNFGLKVMSMGLLVPYDEAIAIRGPMINSYVRALLFQTDWGELDYLVVDMPPGTHDVHITITQEVALSGAVIVSTPQHIAMIDARRGMDLFAKVKVPVLGMVSNMSYFVCDNCDKKHYLFGEKDGVEDVAKELGLPFLGGVPLIKRILDDMDAGKPSTLRGDEEIDAAKPYFDIARRIVEVMKEASSDGASGPLGGGGGQPKIVIE